MRLRSTICGALINRDRRVADLEIVHDPVNGIFNTLFATATTLIKTVDDGSGFPPLKEPELNPFLVKNIFTSLPTPDGPLCNNPRIFPVPSLHQDFVSASSKFSGRFIATTPARAACAVVVQCCCHSLTPGWRNWQTHGT